jgi:CBS domain-containing protein
MTSEYRAGSPAVGRNFIDMTVGEIMEKKVQSAHPDTGADVVASLIVEGFGSLAIVDEQQRLIGVVSEHDLLTVLDGGRRWSDLKAQDVMSRNPYSVRMETTVATLIHVLKSSDLIRVPVVDAQNRLIGIVARRDVVRACLRGIRREGLRKEEP